MFFYTVARTLVSNISVTLNLQTLICKIAINVAHMKYIFDTKLFCIPNTLQSQCFLRFYCIPEQHCSMAKRCCIHAEEGCRLVVGGLIIRGSHMGHTSLIAITIMRILNSVRCTCLATLFCLCSDTGGTAEVVPPLSLMGE